MSFSTAQFLSPSMSSPGNRGQRHALDTRDVTDDLDDDDDNFRCDTELTLTANKTEEYDPTGRATYLKACKNLKITPVSRFLHDIENSKVCIMHRNLGPQGAKAIAATLITNTKICSLNLSSNSIFDKGGSYIAFALVENVYITEINLAYNHLGSESMIALANMLRENNNLTFLDISGNLFSSKDIKLLAEGLEDNFSLKHLNISGNKLGEVTGAYIGHILRNNNGLLTLDLSWNNINGEGAVCVCNGLKQNKSLEVLNWSWNGIADVGVSKLGEALRVNNSLVDLDLSNNLIKDEGINIIVKGLAKNSCLKVLKLQRNITFLPSTGVTNLLRLLLSNRTALQEVDITEIKLEDIWDVLYQELASTRPEVNIRYGIKRKQEVKIKHTEGPDPWDIFKEYMRDVSLNPFELFKTFAANPEDIEDSITRSEFTDGVKKLKILNDYQVEDLADSLDTDGDGTIDFSEFVSKT